MPEPTPSAAPSGPGHPVLARVVPYALLVVLAAELAIWEAFLVPLRVAGVLVPVAVVAAVLGNVGLGLAGARLAGGAGAVVPGLVWVGIATLLGTRRPEGDLVVPGTPVGLAFLVAGLLSSAGVVLVVVARAQARGAGRAGAGAG